MSILVDKNTKIVVQGLTGEAGTVHGNGMLEYGSAVVAATKAVDVRVPLVVRLEGTNVEKGREILQKSGLKIESAADMGDAAKKVIAAAGLGK